MGRKPTPHDLPIGLLPKVSALIDSQLAEAERLWLQLATIKNFALHADPCMWRAAAAVYERRTELLALHRRQLTRWYASQVSLEQQRELGRLEDRMERASHLFIAIHRASQQVIARERRGAA